MCSAIDELPSIEVSRQSEAGEFGLSQELEGHHLCSQISSRLSIIRVWKDVLTITDGDLDRFYE
jgi:hypothetical protein